LNNDKITFLTHTDFTSNGDNKCSYDIHYGPSECSPRKEDFPNDDLCQVEERGNRLSVTVCHFPMNLTQGKNISLHIYTVVMLRLVDFVEL
jgi:hypothetical protein